MGEEGMRELRELTAVTVESSQTNLFEFNPRMSYVVRRLDQSESRFLEAKTSRCQIRRKKKNRKPRSRSRRTAGKLGTEGAHLCVSGERVGDFDLVSSLVSSDEAEVFHPANSMQVALRQPTPHKRKEPEARFGELAAQKFLTRNNQVWLARSSKS